LSDHPRNWSNLLWFILGVATLLLVPSVLPRFYVYLLALIMVTGILVTSLNLVLGHGGMFQFHHAVFYGTGAYACALMITKTNLPAVFAFLMGPVAASILAVIMGLICVRLSKLYFGMLQLSLGSLMWALVFRWYSFTGGDDGIHGIPLPKIVSGISESYYFTAIVCIASMFLMHAIVNSPFGRVFQAIRDNPERSEAVGVDVKRQQLVGQAIAGFFAGVAGVSFVVVEGSVFPDLMFWTLSLEILVMCLLGGWFTFWGPLAGAAIIVVLRTIVGVYTEYWTMVLAIILMLLIFFLPQGVLGFIEEYIHSRRTDTPTRNT